MRRPGWLNPDCAGWLPYYSSLTNCVHLCSLTGSAFYSALPFCIVCWLGRTANHAKSKCLGSLSKEISYIKGKCLRFLLWSASGKLSLCGFISNLSALAIWKNCSLQCQCSSTCHGVFLPLGGRLTYIQQLGIWASFCLKKQTWIILNQAII